MVSRGPIEISVINYIRRLVPLKDVEPSLARVAFRLARTLDSAEADERTLAGISKELRSILNELKERRGEEDELGLDAPV